MLPAASIPTPYRNKNFAEVPTPSENPASPPASTVTEPKATSIRQISWLSVTRAVIPAASIATPHGFVNPLGPANVDTAHEAGNGDGVCDAVPEEDVVDDTEADKDGDNVLDADDDMEGDTHGVEKLRDAEDG